MKFLNTLNRVVIVILCLVLMVALTALLIAPSMILGSLGRWMVDWGDYFQRQDTWLRLGIGVAIAAVVDIILAIIIYLEVRRGRVRFIRVQQVAGGMANISTDSVTELLEHRLDTQSGVIQVDPSIRARGNRVEAKVAVGVARGTNVPEIANQLIKTIQTVLTDELGLQIAGQPEVRVTVLEQKGERPQAAPPPPAASFKATPPPLPPIVEAEPPASETGTENAGRVHNTPEMTDNDAPEEATEG